MLGEFLKSKCFMIWNTEYITVIVRWDTLSWLHEGSAEMVIWSETTSSIGPVVDNYKGFFVVLSFFFSCLASQTPPLVWKIESICESMDWSPKSLILFLIFGSPQAYGLSWVSWTIFVLSCEPGVVLQGGKESSELVPVAFRHPIGSESERPAAVVH